MSESGLEGTVALGLVHPDEPNEVAVGRNITPVNHLPAAVLLMIRDFSAFGSCPAGVIESEGLLARFGIVGCRCHGVGAARSFVPTGRGACGACRE
eukprot:5228089-Pleurochrysis_carterae.AAC.1